MFSQACVKNSVHIGGCIPTCTCGSPSGRYPSMQWGRHPQAGRHPPASRPPTPDGHCSGWYASYWNAFWFETYLGHVLDLFGTFWDSFGTVLDMIRFTLPSDLLTLYIMLQQQNNFRLSSCQQTPIGTCIY